MTTSDKPAPSWCPADKAKLEHGADTGELVDPSTFCEACRAIVAENERRSDERIAAHFQLAKIPGLRVPAGTVTEVNGDGTVRVETGKPALEHPAPWRWIDGDTRLVAADHREWTETDDGHDDIVLSDRLMCIPGEMSPRVRELVRAAPEMEALLRPTSWKTNDCPWCGARFDVSDARHDLACPAGLLLARIDAAKARG